MIGIFHRSANKVIVGINHTKCHLHKKEKKKRIRFMEGREREKRSGKKHEDRYERSRDSKKWERNLVRHVPPKASKS